MKQNARKAYLKAQAEVDNALLSMSNTLGCLEFERRGADTWGDVGTMNSILSKLLEVQNELNRYYAVRVERGGAE